MALSIQDFLDRWLPEDPRQAQAKADLEEMIKEANMPKRWNSGSNVEDR